MRLVVAHDLGLLLAQSRSSQFIVRDWSRLNTLRLSPYLYGEPRWRRSRKGDS